MQATMMSEAQLTNNSSSGDDAAEHADAASRKARSDSSSGEVQQNENEHAHYPTSTEAVSGNDTDGQAISTSAQNEDDVQIAQLQQEVLPENQVANISNVNNKTEANARHEHTDTVNDNSLSRKNKVDNINQALSAPISVLGANSDRSDFFRGGSNPPTNTHYKNYSNDEGTPTTKDNALGKVKSWLVGGGKEDASDTSALDYREFTSPAGNGKRPKANNTTSVEGDVELAINTTNNHSNRRKLQYNGEEEYVMEKCSFAYGSDSPEKYKSPHKIPSIDHQYSNEAIHNDENDNNGDIDDEEDQQYFGRNYQNRRINPTAMAHAITSRAKRTWTERRYRRRLRQSQFIPPNNPAASENDDINGHSSISPTAAAPTSFHYELTSEHRHAFLAAHAALNGKLANEQYRNRHANAREDGFDNDLQFDIEQPTDEEEVRADLTKSSLAIRGGLIRLPVDNVRLVCDEHLQPGVLSIETRDMGGSSSGGTKGYEMFGNANRYGNIHGNMMQGIGDGSIDDQRQKSERIAEVWERHELAYVLTVDQHIYQRVAQEMGDANRVPFGIYFCCHETGGGANHVGIEVAVLMLLIIFFLLVAGMIAWPTW